MGKHGPCYHCGVTSSPLWRNGPPEKPVLCNACGSRWRTKGTLTNYTPLHARAEHVELEARFPKSRNVSSKSKGAKVPKHKLTNDLREPGVPPLDYNHGIHKMFDEDTSNRSSSGSAISNNESCAQYGSADASELTGPSQQPSMWDSSVPSRKRTCIARPKPSPVEKLTKDLYTIWHQQQSSCFSGSSEEDLLVETDKPMISVEIGHGSVLIRHPNSIIKEEESEASSLSFENKLLNTWKVTPFSDLIEDSGAKTCNKRIQKFNKPAHQEALVGTAWENDEMDKSQILGIHESPLRWIDLQDIVNHEKFSGLLTDEEQQKLLKYLPSVDTVETPDSLKSMFGSSHFIENLISFQKLLGDGVFDGTFSGVLSENCRNLQNLALCDLRKSKWVIQYTELKDSKAKTIIRRDELGGFNGMQTVSTMSMSKDRGGQQQKLVVKSPRATGIKSIGDAEKGGSLKGIFPFENDDIILSSYEQDQDLLVDVPSNGLYPEAELLLPSSSSSVWQMGGLIRPKYR